MSALLLLVGLVAVFAGVAAALVALGSLNRERSSLNRTLAVIESSGPVPDSMLEEVDPPFQDRVLAPLQSAAIRLGERLTPADWSERARRRLDLAGNPVGWDPERILASKVAFGLGLGGLSLLLAVLLGWGLVGLAAAGGLAVLGFFGPDLWLSNRATERTKKMRRALPDSLDLLTISVESGLAFDAAMQQVADKTTGPLAAEFRRTLQEIQLGTSRTDALRAMAERTQVEDLRYFVSALAQADRLGIPIADVLRVQAAEMRMKQTQRTEEQAAKLPVKIVFPVLFCIMPAVFIVLLGPPIARIADFFGSTF